ncbi:MAG: polyprenyl synthetase family protein, partial [Candidatus Omnitrophica bacterium]|nr:polyprenyl synthetase family protein [Candidatus Omnitrophota bacterium]
LDYERVLKRYRKTIEGYLHKILPSEDVEPKIIHRAMRYSVFLGGKRIRPLIVFVVGRMLGVEEKKILPVACGIELIHNFSLIHDDLPAMDNDDYRRGKKTCHRKFNEAVAILAGDALLTLGFKLIAEAGNIQLIKETSDAIGSQGMAGGQVIDILYKDRKIPLREKRNMDYLKTGRLFQLCFSIPLFFTKVDKETRKKILCLGNNFGLAFQIRDDMEDKQGDRGILKEKMKGYFKKMRKDITFFGEKGGILLYIIEQLYNGFDRDGNI